MIHERPEQWDLVTDVVVVGTGGAALTAATLAADGGASVVVLEKDRAIGGTTGVSGGVMWVPQNHHMAEAGEPDDRQDALDYILTLCDGRAPDPHLVEVFVDTAPEMLRYLESKTPLQTQPVAGFPDYYFGFDVPGKRSQLRSVEPLPFPVGELLPEYASRLATRTTLMSLGASTTLSEDMAAMMGGAAPEDAVVQRRQEDDVRVKGAAYVAALLKGLLEREVEIRTETAAAELVVENGSVIGVRAVHEGADVVIGARRGVVLACGGFEWNAEMVRGFIGYAVQPVSPPNNTGDGHVMAMEAGAELGNMMSYWGTGVMFDPSVTRDGGMVPQMDAGRGMPGTLIVNRSGDRFVNEGVTYNDFPKVFGTFDPNVPGFPNTPPAWMIFDRTVKASTPILSLAPGADAPDWVIQAPTIAELATRIGVAPERLVACVGRFNDCAVAGEDPDFGRPLGRPLDDSGPYYALEIHPGTLGTNGGLRINEDGQVRAYRGGVIPGLYSAGNTSAGVFGWAYPSGGSPIAVGATFGYRAGRHVAAQPSRNLD